MKTFPLRHRFILLPAALILAFAAGCERPGNPDPQVTATEPPHPPGALELHAVARLDPTQDQQARGTVRFHSEGDAVRVVAELTGLTPGEHGIHIHENGDCSAPDASSAGGHFNPTDQPHAARDAEARHLGDLGNISADSNGRAELNYLDRHLSLTGEHSIVGRAVVVHSGPDDLKSQPSGNSGARVACGRIEIERKNL